MKVWSIILLGIVCASVTGAPEKKNDAAVITPAWQVLTPDTIYTKDTPPATPKLADLPLKESVTQYGITWTFDQPAHVGQFVNGDYYVVGPVTVTALDPKPLYGKDVPESELDPNEKNRPESQRLRNGFMLNPPAARKVAYDSGTANFYTPALVQKLPVTMKPGDSLVSTISLPQGTGIKTEWKTATYYRGKPDYSPTRVAAVLTCVSEPQPPDAFRPGFCDRQAKIYLARNFKRDLLPTVAVVGKMPKVELFAGYTQKPWLGTCMFGFEQPYENMPAYGREVACVSGIAALMLCTDLKPEQKEPLLINYVQVGLDLGAMIRAGHPGWEGFGGHDSGRKLPIIFAGLLLGDEQLANINKSFPKASFGEDEQTAYGDCWTGAKVVFAGHRGINTATGIAYFGTGPYEHKQPKNWTDGPYGKASDDKESEAYRACCTSSAWLGEAQALHLMKAEKAWNHDAFLDYCDRWMYEKLTPEQLKEGKAAFKDLANEGEVWYYDAPFVKPMWEKYRAGPGMPATDGWQKQHDDSYLRTAIEKLNAGGKAK